MTTKVTQYLTTVHSTEEVTSLFTDIQRQGGQILGTYTLRNGGGISVKFKIPKNQPYGTEMNN